MLISAIKRRSELTASILIVLAVVAGGIPLWFLYQQNAVLAFGLTVALIPTLYLAARPTHIRAFHLMILTLPILTAFVIDIGGNLRVPYYFAVIAFLLAIFQRQLRLPVNTWPILCLYAFMVYAAFTITYVFQYDAPASEFVQYGFRNSALRPIIQFGQLFLMFVFFWLTLNFLTSEKRLHTVSRLIFWSLFVVVCYGVYEVAAAVFDFRFFNINTNPDYLDNRFAGTQLSRVGDIYIPRPRSTVLEPINLSIYILFSLPFGIAMLQYEKRAPLRWLIIGCAFSASILLLLAWSRAGFIAAFFVLVATLFLVRSPKAKLRLFLFGTVTYLVIGLGLLPILGAGASVTYPLTIVKDRIQTVADLPGSFSGDAVSSRKIGRNYSGPLEVFKRWPIKGAGLGSYFLAFSQVHGGPVQVAPTGSLYLQLLTRVGLIGTFLYLMFAGLIVWRLFKAIMLYKHHHLRPLAVASFLSIVGVMVGHAALTGITVYPYLWVMFAIGLAIPPLMKYSVADRQEPRGLAPESATKP